MATLALAFGPTGGHLIPATLVAEEWQDRTGGECHMFSTASPDQVFLSDCQSSYHQIDYQAWAGQGLSRLMTIPDTIKIYPEIRNRLSDVDLMVGFGGYPSVPVLIGAWERGIPIFLQEQNRVIGRANKLFLPWCQKLYCGLPPMEPVPGTPSAVVGNPVRHMEPRNEDWFQQSPLLVVFGGSQGARTLSDRLDRGLDLLLQRGWKIYHVMGQYGESISQRRDNEIDELREVDVDWNLPEVIAHADCLWGRAGAGTISEVMKYQVPAVLFPYPHAADDHQRENAEWLQSVGPSKIGTHVNTPLELVNLTGELAEKTDFYTVPWKRDTPAERRMVTDLLEWV